ncbi:MAG: T9SS type A sorting domain-containing protein [Crocinitomicaceae bacterium]
MKRIIKSALVLGTFTLFSNMSLAYLYTGSSNVQPKGNDKVKPSNSEKGAACAPAVKKYILDFNDVSALLQMGGRLFEDEQKSVAGYEVPKGGGAKAIFAAALWMGGRDQNGQLKLAAVRFRQVGNDFWGGPLTVTIPYAPNVNYNPLNPVGDNTIRPYGDGNISGDQCAKYDKFFPINKASVIRFSIWWESCIDPNKAPGACDLIGEESLPTNAELAAITEWPAHGDPSLFQDYYLAPFYDRNADQIYNPMDDGDYPWYDDILGRDDVQCGVDRRVTLFGDQTVWFVFNDKGNVHTESQGEPIGMEIRAQAFAFATSDEINRMTFYNYELINRSTQTLTNTFFSQYVDPDLGYSGDDYVGCDVSRGLGYCYNGTPNDVTNGSQIGYGQNPPAIGVDFFEGPYQDPDNMDNPGPVWDATTQSWITPTVSDAILNKGIVYNGIGTGYGDGVIDNERFGMRRFTYFTNAASYPYTDPSVANQYYNFMSGSWADGSNITFGGTGAGGSILTDYVFPGDSDPLHWGTAGVDPGNSTPWTEASAGNAVGDRRFVQSAGPFTLVPGASNNITVGIVYGRAAGGDLMASVDLMKTADTKAQALFDACFRIIDPPNAPKLQIQELENELILTLSNPTTSNNYLEKYEEIDDINIPVTETDRKYRFEGYQIFQLVDDVASVADIHDLSKARLVAQCDIKNGVKDLTNFTLNEQYGILEGKRMVTGADAGIQHTFRLTKDAFALGDDRLVNHKTYYYVAVAYGYNQFKPYDQNDPTKLDGQKKPYISSRLSYDGTSIQSVPGTPHNPRPEAGGTFQLAEYGTTPRITRLDGYGNGNRALELTTESRNTIINSGSLAKLKYDFGGGPVNVKVIDPLNVVNGYFELEFNDYTPTSSIGSYNSADTASWVIRRYASEGGDLIDTISSEHTIKVDNEQIIPQWGVSVQIYQTKYTNTSTKSQEAYAMPISSSITFADSSKRWLMSITDNDLYQPTNWIRSGTAAAGTADPTAPAWLNPANYGDELAAGGDPDQHYEKVLNGGIAPQRVTGYNVEFMPMAYMPNVTPSYSRELSSISYLPSVDIVITSDKSKWTRVPVIEMGRDNTMTFGGASAGQMRKSQSVDKNGNPDGTGTGMGWFPGYAIDLETGNRLYMAFGENSYMTQDNGRDMIWNPSSRMVDNNGNFVMGGVHPVWIYGSEYQKINGVPNHLRDMPAYDPSVAVSNNFLEEKLREIEAGTNVTNNTRFVYGNLAWIAYPMLTPGQTLLSTDVTIKLRVNKEYKNYVATNANAGKPKYSWNMDEIATKTGNRQALSEVLEMINIVPNPYLAYSEYEKSRLDTRVKIVNLPEVCTVTIYSSNGKLIRQYKKDSPVTSIDWDLNNHSRIPVASGMYLIHVKVPDVGERVLKAFIGVRQVDLQGI